MKKIRLVHFTSSLKMGGAEKVLFDLITHLDANKYEHIVIYIYDGPYRERLHSNSIPTYCVRGLFSRYDPFIFIRLWRILKKLQPDIMHTLLWSANLIGRLIAKCMGIPCAVALHNNNQQNGVIRTFLDRVTAHVASPIIAVSQEVAQSAVQCAWMPAQKIHVIPNGIRVIQAQKRITRAMLGIPKHDFVIGSVGRFHPVKRYHLLLTMFAQMAQQYSSVYLVLIGIGEQEQALRVYAYELGIASRVTFIIGEPACDYYPLFDCFVQTSMQEGISIALLEAMSFGVPCVVMNQGDTHSVVTSGKNGIVVSSDDYVRFIQALYQLMQDDMLRTRLGVHAKYDIQQRFSLDCMVKSYDSLFMGMRRD